MPGWNYGGSAKTDECNITLLWCSPANHGCLSSNRQGFKSPQEHFYRLLPQPLATQRIQQASKNRVTPVTRHTGVTTPVTLTVRDSFRDPP